MQVPPQCRQSRIQENLSAIKVIKAYGAEAPMAERFNRDSRIAFDAVAKKWVRS